MDWHASSHRAWLLLLFEKVTESFGGLIQAVAAARLAKFLRHINPAFTEVSYGGAGSADRSLFQFLNDTLGKFRGSDSFRPFSQILQMDLGKFHTGGAIAERRHDHMQLATADHEVIDFQLLPGLSGGIFRLSGIGVAAPSRLFKIRQYFAEIIFPQVGFEGYFRLNYID